MLKLCGMNYASKSGHIRMLFAFCGIAAMFVVGYLTSLASDTWPKLEAIFAVVFAFSVPLGILVFWYTVFHWKTKCPKCLTGVCRMTHDKNDREFLSCESCDYSEETGYDLE